MSAAMPDAAADAVSAAPLAGAGDPPGAALPGGAGDAAGATPPATVDAEIERAVAGFLRREARLLDGRHFAEWLALFAPDGLYWVPSQPGQTDALNLPSIIHEDRGILAMRVQRLLEARALVMTPMPRTLHLLGNIEVSAATGGTVEAEAALVMVEVQDGRKSVLAGRCFYRLRRAEDGFRIVLKRVDLLDCDGRHGPITVPP
ncbi:aromatic-ring-hydroxylating dioxygenase subunit beta [Roseomonas sp. BN140053]|uniref:aromatic-ring-hydroxylating dioxygenase subunit beta n=1 Tax=Roseomonas sp. BN140053 TaxID=3391898 RepID=UPI0039ED3936